MECDEHDPSNKPRRLRTAVVTAAVCLPIIGAGQFISHARHDEIDAWLFRYIGHQITEGQVLYRDLWDNKPPLIFWFNAASDYLSGGSVVGVIVMCSAAVCGGLACFFAVCRRLYGGPVAGIATVLAAVFVYHHHFYVGGNRPNTFIVLAEWLAVLAYVRATGGNGRVSCWMMLVGVFSAAGFCLKQNVLGIPVAVVVHQVYLSMRSRSVSPQSAPSRSAPGPARSVLLVLAGWALAVAVVAALLGMTADLRWAWDAVIAFNRRYFQVAGGSTFLPTSFFGVRECVSVLGLPLIVAAATCVHGVVVRTPSSSKEDDSAHPQGWLLFLWVWQLVSLYGAMLGPARRMHYYGAALAPLALLCAHGVYLLVVSGRSYRGRQPVFHVVVGVVWMAWMVRGPLTSQWHAVHIYHHHFVNPDDSRYERIVELVDVRTRSDDSVFVWSYDPELYWRMGRPAAVRFLVNDKISHLGSNAQPLLDEIIAALRESQPRIIIVSEAALRAMTRARHGAEHRLDYGDFPLWVQESYVLLDADGRREIWIRRDRAASRASPAS